MISLRAMLADDLGLIAGWMTEPHVARWYVSGSTVEHELGELRQCLAAGHPTVALVIEEDGRPIGFCQWYPCDAYPEHATAVGAAPGDVGIDYAIGDPARIGSGVGTALIGTLVAHVRTVHPAAGVIADPAADNVASRLVLERNGFELVKEGPIESEPTDAVMAVYRLPFVRDEERD